MNGITIPAHLLREDATLPQAKNKMGKDDFMKLLLTQLQNQDPLKPMDHQDFATQLAQFGTLEKLGNIEKGIQGLNSGAGEESKLQALGMIGKRVEATGETLSLTKGKPIEVKPQLSEGAKLIRASFYNQQGKLVRDISLGSKATSEIQWDGKDHEGNPLPTGQYTFRITAINKDGKAEQIGSHVRGRVTAVNVTGPTPILEVDTGNGSQQIEMARVSKVTVDAPANSPRPTSINKVSDKPKVEGLQSKADPAKDGQSPISVGNAWEPFDRAIRGYPTINPISRGKL